MRQVVSALNGCVRPLVALIFAVGLLALTWRGDVQPTDFVPLVAFVLGYWFRARDSESKESVVPHG